MTISINTISQNAIYNRTKAITKNGLNQLNPALQTNNSLLGLEALAMQNKALMFTGKTTEIDPATKTMRSVLENVKIANVSNFHTAAVDVIDIAKTRGFVSEERPLKLLHFDEHADIRTKGNTRIDFGNWINTVIENGTVDEVYWILPEWTLFSEYKERYWDNKTDEASIYFCNNNKEIKIYVNKETRELNFEKPADYDSNEDKYKVVNVHKLTIEDLPQFSENDNLMLDVCGDYLLSNVEDAFICRESTSYIHYEIEERFNKIFSELEKKGAKPIIYTGAESIDYVPLDFYKEVVKNLQKAVGNASNGNLTNELITHKNDDNLAIEKKPAKNTLTVDTFLGPLLFNLKYLENETGVAIFNKSNTIGKEKAIKEITTYFETDSQTAEEIYNFIGQNLCTEIGSVYEIETNIKYNTIIDYKEAFLKQFEGRLKPWQIGL